VSSADKVFLALIALSGALCLFAMLVKRIDVRQGIASDLAAAWAHFLARRERRRILSARYHIKASIERVGDALVGPESIVLGEGWIFDCSNGAVAHSVGPDGLPRFCGYTVRELKEIYARRAEFNTEG
jgi:hypothetical protein